MTRSAAAFLILILHSVQAMSAETMMGPIDHICVDITQSEERTHLTLMWVVGYISGINNLQKPDMLKDVSMDRVIDMFRDACLEKPTQTVLEAARSTVARLRSELAQKRAR